MQIAFSLKTIFSSEEYHIIVYPGSRLFVFFYYSLHEYFIHNQIIQFKSLICVVLWTKATVFMRQYTLVPINGFSLSLYDLMTIIRIL